MNNLNFKFKSLKIRGEVYEVVFLLRVNSQNAY